MAKRSDDSLYALPDVTEIENKADRVELAMLLQEAYSLRQMEARLKQVKARITELVQGWPGVRSGDQCAIVRWQDGNRSIDRGLLVENGVTPEQIEASCKTGKGYWVCELPRIGEEAR